MLAEFRIKNFKRIRELKLDLRYAQAKAPNGYKESDILAFVEEDEIKESRAVPVLAIFGPNASGKTTILQAANALVHIVNTRFHPSYFLPNKIGVNAAEIQNSELGVTFYRKSIRFDFSLKYDALGIQEESLSIDGNTAYKVQNSQVFLYSKQLEKFQKDLMAEFQARCIHSRFQRQERTFLWCLRKEFPGIGQEFLLAYQFFSSQLRIFSTNNVPPGDALELLTDCSSGSTQEEKRKNAIKKVSALLKKFDSGIEGVGYRVVEISNDSIENSFSDFSIGSYKINPYKGKLEKVELETFHKSDDGSLVEFDFFREESRGTQRTLSLIAIFLWALETGNVLWIDELESSLHPLLVLSLVNMFKSKNFNSHNAQLIFTTHNTELLEAEILRLSEVALVDRRGFGKSPIIRLSEIKGLRNANNFRRRYMRGDFGGIPFPVP